MHSVYAQMQNDMQNQLCSQVHKLYPQQRVEPRPRYQEPPPPPLIHANEQLQKNMIVRDAIRQQHSQRLSGRSHTPASHPGLTESARLRRA
jgi:hypothetical protein